MSQFLQGAQDTSNLRPGILRLYCTVPIDTDLRRSIEVLRQLQDLAAATTSCDPSLADIVDLIATIQAEYGEQCSLETVIQTLVAKDIEQQAAKRRQAKQKDASLAMAGPSSTSQNRAMCMTGVS